MLCAGTLFEARCGCVLGFEAPSPMTRCGTRDRVDGTDPAARRNAARDEALDRAGRAFAARHEEAKQQACTKVGRSLTPPIEWHGSKTTDDGELPRLWVVIVTNGPCGLT